MTFEQAKQILGPIRCYVKYGEQGRSMIYLDQRPSNKGEVIIAASQRRDALALEDLKNRAEKKRAGAHGSTSGPDISRTVTISK